MAKSTYLLHNTMKPSTRQAAVEHEAWARGTRGPELKDHGPEIARALMKKEKISEKENNSLIVRALVGMKEIVQK